MRLRGLLLRSVGRKPTRLHSLLMYLLYLDDSGSPLNAAEEYFVLGGICVFENQIDWFSREIDKLATSYPGNPEDVEFHASSIFSRREAPWNTLSIDAARGVLKSVLHVVQSSYATTRLFACAIHKKSFPGQDPVELAFEDLCKRFDILLSRLRAEGENHRGRIVLDRTTRENVRYKNLAASSARLGLNGACSRTSWIRRSSWIRKPHASCRSPIMWPILYFAVMDAATRNILTSSAAVSMKPTASFTAWSTRNLGG